MPWYVVYLLLFTWFVVAVPVAVGLGRASRRTPPAPTLVEATPGVPPEPLAEVISLADARARRMSADAKVV